MQAFVTLIAALLFAPTPLLAQQVIVVPPSKHAPPPGSAPPASRPRANPVIQAPTPQNRPEAPAPTPQQPDIRVDDSTEAACTADALALVPAGTRVLGTSVSFTHSVPSSVAPTGTLQVPPPGSTASPLIYFYEVTVDAEQGGQQFQYRFQCRQWGSQIRIMRRAVEQQ